MVEGKNNEPFIVAAGNGFRCPAVACRIDVWNNQPVAGNCARNQGIAFRAPVLILQDLGHKVHFHRPVLTIPALLHMARSANF